MDVYCPLLLEAESLGRDVAGVGEGFLPGPFELLVAPGSPGSPGSGPASPVSACVTWPSPAPLYQDAGPCISGPPASR